MRYVRGSLQVIAQKKDHVHMGDSMLVHWHPLLHPRFGSTLATAKGSATTANGREALFVGGSAGILRAVGAGETECMPHAATGLRSRDRPRPVAVQQLTTHGDVRPILNKTRTQRWDDP